MWSTPRWPTWMAVADLEHEQDVGSPQRHRAVDVEEATPNMLGGVAAVRRSACWRTRRWPPRRNSVRWAELDRTHPGAAASLREGMAETLTVLRLGVSPTLARTLRSTNAIESMISICRTHSATSRTGATARWRCAGAPPG
jgi:putative transposase